MVSVTVRDTVPPRSVVTDVDVFFVVGLSEKGTTTPRLVRSMADFTRYYGDRVNYGDLYDYLDAYFREGGSRAYVARVLGDVPTSATVTLDDDAAADTLAVTANSPGAWGATLRVSVLAGVEDVDAVRIRISNADGDILETSPEFTTKDELLEWADSAYVNLASAGVSTDLPAIVGATALVGGDDDRDTIDAASYTAALATFSKSLGPGQVAVPGNVDSTVQAALLAHASERNRVALLDAPDSDNAATLTAAALALRADVNARYGGMFGPRAYVAGVTPSTRREVPWTVIQAAMIARNGRSNNPAAGELGEARTVLDLKHTYTDDERDDLNDAGVNVAIPLYNQFRMYGYRSLASPTTLPGWVQFNGVRTIMGIKHEADVIGERHIFKNIDGKGFELGAFGGELTAMLADFYESNALYGQSPQDAFFADTGSQVNTPESIAAGELRANLLVRVSPFAEYVNIEIVKAPLPSVVGPSPLAIA
jgi:hypothetical protein